MTRTGAATAVLVGLIAATGTSCLPSVEKDINDQPRGVVMIETENGIIPTPFDVLRNPANATLPELLDCPTCTMAFPMATDTITGAVLDTLDNELFANMNLINGFIVAMPISIPFDMVLDAATLTADNVKLYDATDPANPTLVSPDAYYLLWNLEGATEKPYKLTIINKSTEFLGDPAPWKVGGRYVLAMSDKIKGVRTTDNGAAETLFLGGHPMFYFIKGSEPLLDAKGNRLTDVLDQSDDNGKVNMELTMGLVANVESMRQIASPLFESGLLDYDTTPVVIVFTIKSNPEATFLPGSTLGNVLPHPSDLTKDAPAADAVKLSIPVSADLAASTLTNETVKLFKATDLTEVTLSDIGVVATTDKNGGTTYAITATAPTLEAKTKYVAYVTDGVTDTDGAALSAGTYFALARARNPLLTKKTVDGEEVLELTSSIVAGNAISVYIKLGNDPSDEVDPDSWALAQTMLTTTINGLETLRQGYQPVFDALDAAGTPRTRIVALWTFTTKTAE